MYLSANTYSCLALFKGIRMGMSTPVAEIFVKDSEWVNAGSDEDPTSRLHHAAKLGGYGMHIEAFAVNHSSDTDPSTIQCAADPTFNEEVDAILTLIGQAAQTKSINGREYIINVSPYGE